MFEFLKRGLEKTVKKLKEQKLIVTASYKCRACNKVFDVKQISFEEDGISFWVKYVLDTDRKLKGETPSGWQYAEKVEFHQCGDYGYQKGVGDLISFKINKDQETENK